MSNNICFVINSLEPYQYEIPNFLALPIGATIRLRYDVKWLEVSSINKESLTHGIEGAIYFNGCKKAQGTITYPLESVTYFPLRKIKYLSHEKLGDIYYFILELGSYFDYPKDYIDTEQSKNLKRALEKDKLVFIDPQTRTLKNDDYIEDNVDLDNRQWVRTVEQLLKLDTFQNLDFYRISKIENANTKAKSSPQFHNGSLKIEESSSYDLWITQLRYSAASKPKVFEHKRGIELLESENINVSKSFAMAVGKYDVLRLSFSTTKLKHTHNSLILFKYTIPQKLSETMDNILSIPLTIEKKHPQYIMRALIALTFSILYLAPGFSFIPAYCLSTETLSLVKDISMIGFTVTLVDLLHEYRSSRE
jgi:hypothetical protein